MAAKRLDFKILQGETFQRVIRWETPPYVYKAITAITKDAPVRITAPGHGLTHGWRAAVVSVLGMTEINANHSPPRSSEFYQVTYVDADTVLMNAINSAEFSTYESGGFLQYFTPVDIAGYTARMQIRDRVGGALLLLLSSDTLIDPYQRIILDASGKVITINIAADDLEASDIAWTRGVYDLEMVSPTGAVTRLFTGSISISKEVTT